MTFQKEVSDLFRYHLPLSRYDSLLQHPEGHWQVTIVPMEGVFSVYLLCNNHRKCRQPVIHTISLRNRRVQSFEAKDM